MKRFEMEEVRAAIEHAENGGQSLHVHTLTMNHPLFSKYPQIAHLMDRDANRLIATAKRLGVRVIKVEREGERGQHIDLCGRPFEKATQEATREIAMTLEELKIAFTNLYQLIDNEIYIRKKKRRQIRHEAEAVAASQAGPYHHEGRHQVADAAAVAEDGARRVDSL